MICTSVIPCLSTGLAKNDKIISMLMIIFEWQILPQQTIYRWKGNLTANRIHFKYWKNILISRIYEQFSQNSSAMVPEPE